MKKRFIVFFLILCSVSSFIFAESTLQDLRLKDAETRGLTFLASQEGNSLYKDKSNKLYYYCENWLFDEVYVYKQDSKVSKEEVKSKMEKAKDVHKEIDDNNYTVYFVYMGIFSPKYYYVKTPNGDYYLVSERIKTIDGSTNKYIDEL